MKKIILSLNIWYKNIYLFFNFKLKMKINFEEIAELKNNLLGPPDFKIWDSLKVKLKIRILI